MDCLYVRLFPLASLLIASAAWFGCGEDEARRTRSRTTVLVDAVHQIDGLPQYEWTADQHRYTHSASTAKLFDVLAASGVDYDVHRKGPLTDDVLKDVDVLFFNVPRSVGESKKKKKLYGKTTAKILPQEVASIQKFVKEGGGLFLVVEHNNAYDNVSVLKPLLEPWGVKVEAAYAHEKSAGRYAINNGAYRILVRRFEDHFITEGVDMISMAGAAPLSHDSPGGLAFLSEDGFVDLGDYVSLKPSKFSNNRVDEGEYKGGDIPVAVALEVGKGRVVVVGDHNMLGAHWIGFGDNLEFCTNAFQWLAGREKEQRFAAKDKPWTVFGIEQDTQRWSIGAKEKGSHYGFYLGLTKGRSIFPRGMTDYSRPVDVLGFLEPKGRIAEDGIARAKAMLAEGKTVFHMFDVREPTPGSLQLLSELTPDVRFTAGKEGRFFVPGEKSEKEIPLFKGAYLPVRSEEMKLRKGAVAALMHSKDAYKRINRNEMVPKDYDKGVPFLMDVDVKGAEPVAWAVAPDGRKLTLLATVKVGKGEVILMPQAKVWTTQTLPAFIVRPAKVSTPAYDFLMDFVAWLESRAKKSSKGA